MFFFTFRNSAGSKLAQYENQQIEKEVTRKLIFAWRLTDLIFFNLFQESFNKKLFLLDKRHYEIILFKNHNIY